MVKIAGIFCRNQRINHILGDIVEVDRHAALFAEFANQFAVVGENTQRCVQFKILQLANVGQSRREVDSGTNHRQYDRA